MIKPALVKKPIILSHSSTQIEIKLLKNKITESLLIRRVLEIIKSVIKDLKQSYAENHWYGYNKKHFFKVIDGIDMFFVISIPIKVAELKTTSGTVRILKRLTIAVKLTDNATSPFANLVKMFEVAARGSSNYHYTHGDFQR